MLLDYHFKDKAFFSMPAIKPATKVCLLVVIFYHAQQNYQLPENKINALSS